MNWLLVDDFHRLTYRFNYDSKLKYHLRHIWMKYESKSKIDWLRWTQLKINYVSYKNSTEITIPKLTISLYFHSLCQIFFTRFVAMTDFQKWKPLQKFSNCTVWYQAKMVVFFILSNSKDYIVCRLFKRKNIK